MLSNVSVGEEFVRIANAAPDAPALYWLTPDGVGSLTWKQLYQRASSAAHRLKALDPGRGRVALISYNSVDWIVAMYGCALAGRPVVPISPAATAAEVTHMLSLAQVTTVLVVDRAGDDAPLIRVTEAARHLPHPPGVHDIAEFNIPSDSLVAPEPVEANSEFLVQFTSGTTGVPKAAVLSHRASVNCARIYADGCTARKGEIWLNPLPLFHVGGSVAGLLVSLELSSAYVVMDRFSPDTALRVIREVRPALVGLVPTMIIDLLNLPGASAADFTSVRLVIGGATAVDPSLIADVESRLGITFMVAYGQSEAPTMTVSAPDDSAAVRTRTLGRCLPGRDYRIVAADGGIAALGEVGELGVRGPLTMTGYLQGDGSIDPATDTAGWRGTGDLCSMDADGVVTFHGRIREMIIRGGLNVFPAEVERVVSAHGSVSEVAVFGVHDPRLGERVVAAILPSAHHAVDLDDLASLAEEQLSHYKRPSEWIIVRKVPRTSTGKIRKHQLREWYENGSIRAECDVVQNDRWGS
ncbi:class I adenylate-forming enzyme family protein [Nocardia sp. alder85J]|nr:class I adenylate-forming enzyme family protein [Nocardia sp. alder85J]